MLQAQLFFDKDELIGTESMEDFIMGFLIKHKVIGATLIRCESGFGPNQLLKRPDELFSFDEIPMMITFIDEETKVRETLTKLRQLVSSCFIITFQVERW